MRTEQNEHEKVAAMAKLMAVQLIENRSKGDWSTLPAEHVLENIRKQTHEAEQLILDMKSGRLAANPQNLAILDRKCANGANYFLILADNWGTL